MIEQPLVTVGIPTYNRPEGLRKTLDVVTKQTYRNLEIIVSDNGSPSKETEDLVREFSENDNRIRFFKQEVNKGIFFNFYFVLEQAHGDYYMWAADDDEWQGTEFLSELMKHAPDNILTFPEAIIKDEKNNDKFLLKEYEKCQTKLDYSRTFCVVGWGHPMYGIFNMKLFNLHKLEFHFPREYSYYMEGEFLHKLFLTGPAKYVQEAKIRYSPGGARPSIDLAIDNFTKYFIRTILLYANSDIPKREKAELIKLVMNTNLAYCKALFESVIPEEIRHDVVLEKPQGAILKVKPVRPTITRQFIRKIKTELAVFFG